MTNIKPTIPCHFCNRPITSNEKELMKVTGIDKKVVSIKCHQSCLEKWRAEFLAWMDGKRDEGDVYEGL